ncbi:hypothetical protein CDAR_71761 [Caerostris darwini]|uniref:Uncharacterized protein n=1 Tax=Caerostris darwini TaxID=1538125 RepID=A0AAV4TJ52_9ARAC|nr:hypothetical protein CDAR_71761 [Caerostris darwini]
MKSRVAIYPQCLVERRNFSASFTVRAVREKLRVALMGFQRAHPPSIMEVRMKGDSFSKTDYARGKGCSILRKKERLVKRDSCEPKCLRRDSCENFYTPCMMNGPFLAIFFLYISLLMILDDLGKAQGHDNCPSIADKPPDTGVSSFMSNMIPATNCPPSPGMERGGR